jgi:hypothetical protein
MRWSLQDPRLRRGLRISKPSHVSSNAPIGPLIAKLAPQPRYSPGGAGKDGSLAGRRIKESRASAVDDSHDSSLSFHTRRCLASP